MRPFAKLLTLATFGLALTGIATREAQALPVTYDLVDGNNNLTFQVGDKIFSDFFCSVTANNPSQATEPDSCSEISIITLDDDPFGISFVGAFAALANANFPEASEDVLIEYSVMVAQGSPFLISDIHLSSNPAVFEGTGIALAQVVETVYSDPTHLNVLAQIVVQNPPPILTAFAEFAPINKVYVRKDIQLDAAIGTEPPTNATISFVDQRFSQTPVPEPATLGLLGIGLLGLGAMLRRRAA